MKDVVQKVETMDVKDKLVVIRVDHVNEFVTQARETLTKLRDTFVENGATSVIILPKNVDIETLGEADLRKMGLVRIVSDFGKELESIQ